MAPSSKKASISRTCSIRILLLSFSDIVDATGRSFDWSAVFKFGSKDADYAAELRAAEPRAAAAPSSDQAPAASSAPIALGSATGRVALAAAPSLPTSDQADAVAKGPRSVRIATSVDRAVSAETLLLDLAAAGETAAHEISIGPDTAPAFGDGKGDPMAKPAFADFPRYDGKGLPLAAVRAAIYLDLQSNPGSVYALIGDGFRGTLVPSFDEAGRLNFAFFSAGKEASWNDLLTAKHDLKTRIVRVAPAS